MFLEDPRHRLPGETIHDLIQRWGGLPVISLANPFILLASGKP
jgi:hypothetical protein